MGSHEDVDAVEEEGQNLGRQLVDVSTVSRPVKPGFFEPFVPKGKARPIKIEKLDAVPPAADEDEEMTSDEGALHAVAHQRRKAVDRAAHVDRLFVEIGRVEGGEGFHARPIFSAATNWASSRGSTVAGKTSAMSEPTSRRMLVEGAAAVFAFLPRASARASRANAARG